LIEIDGELDVVEEEHVDTVVSSIALPLQGEVMGRGCWVLLERQVEATGEVGPKEIGSEEAPGTAVGFRIFIGSGRGIPGIWA